MKPVSELGRARTWVLAWLALSVAGLSLFVGVGCGTKANTCPFRSSHGLSSTDGGTIFLATCATCHGRDAHGGNGPDLLSGSPASYDLTMLIGKISHGKPLAGMPAFGKPSLGGSKLTPEQIRAVASYLISLRSASSSPSGSAS